MQTGTKVDGRERLHAMWASVAGAWEDHAEYVGARGAHLTERMLDRTRPEPGERVLELACGTGDVGLTVAARIAPNGTVVVSDVVPQMTALAAARAAELRLENVLVRTLDLEAIDEPDHSYDVVLCREGLMLVLDPGRAAREIRRVLRPGGRVAVAVWGPRERNPWLGIVFDAVSAQLGTPLPPPGIPGPFSLSDADEVAGLFVRAGLTEVRVEEVSVPARAASFDEWWARTAALAGPLAQRLAALPDEAMEALRARVRDAIGPYETPAGLEFPGVALLASARVD